MKAQRVALLLSLWVVFGVLLCTPAQTQVHHRFEVDLMPDRMVIVSCGSNLAKVLDKVLAEEWPVELRKVPAGLDTLSWSLGARRVLELWQGPGGPTFLDLPGRKPEAEPSEQAKLDAAAGVCLALPRLQDEAKIAEQVKSAGATVGVTMAYWWAMENRGSADAARLGFKVAVELSLIEPEQKCVLALKSEGRTPAEYLVDPTKKPDLDSLLVALTATLDEALDGLGAVHHPCLDKH